MRNEDYILTDSEVEEFDKLYDGTLSEEEYYVIKAKLKLDEVLKHKFHVYKLLRKEIEQDGLANKILKERFANMELKLKKRRFRLFSVLTSFLIVTVFVFIFSYKNDNVKIYEKYRDSESGISIRMNNLIRNKLDTAMIEIAKGDYSQAISTLGQLTATDTTMYFKAYCNERLGNYNVALIEYVRLISSSATIISQKSTFRSALLKLRAGDKNALVALRSIAADPDNLYNRTAQEILESLSKH
jgi:hypothetical protein